MNLKLTNLGSPTNKCFSLLIASCLMLEINKFGCYEAKIEESEKASSCWELNPGHLRLKPASALPLSHNSPTTTNPHNPPCVRLRYSIPPVQHTECFTLFYILIRHIPYTQYLGGEWLWVFQRDGDSLLIR